MRSTAQTVVTHEVSVRHSPSGWLIVGMETLAEPYVDTQRATSPVPVEKPSRTASCGSRVSVTVFRSAAKAS